ncbi:glycine-rich domain-containing protein 2-like [Silene latifolia]|uniref:glycine-rich domain-containing protein 2-like n=1 Tax=Silene latifolia TaxID=37657 RepID=UPI003D76BB5A
MEKEQVNAWAVAQNISVSIDLVEAAKTHLKFLDALEHRNRFLFEDHALQRAVYRYNAFWLPLLAKHEENPVSEEALIVPLDCELIWHCHRLNPVRYKFDCEKLFGRILTNHKVMSSIQATSKSTSEDIWSKLYPEEPYELDLERPFSEESLQKSSQTQKFTNYDLIAAVKRQIGFTYQACRPHMADELFLKEASARYKGFLHIIRTNKKIGLQSFGVPTYDVDLMWHTHQLYPDSYCKDMKELIGGVLPHIDSDPDKSKGSRLDTGFNETTQRWEQTFGFSYWKAGAMSRGDIPTPVTRVPYKFNVDAKKSIKTKNFGQHINFPNVEATEVLLEFVDIKNLPNERKENLLVAISKNQPDTLFKTKRWLGISSASKDKLFAYFECESAGEFLFELMSYSPTSDDLKPKRSLKHLGSCSISLKDMLASQSQLWTNKWLSLDPISGVENSEPVLLHVSISFSPPMRAPQVFHLARCQHVKSDLVETRVMDCSGKKVFNLQKRNISKDSTKGPYDLSIEVYYITASGKKHALVEYYENEWTVKGTHDSFKLQKRSENNDSLFEFAGYNKIVKLFPGRRLQPGPKQSSDEKSEQDFTTMVEFSTDYPYGRAVGLINSKLRTIKAMDELIVLPSIALTFILSENLSGDEQSGFSIDGEEKVNAKGSFCCGMCADTVDEKVNAKGSVCCGISCEPGMDTILKLAQTKKVGDGAQCIGQCTNCGDLNMVRADDCMDKVKAADCMDRVKAADCMDRVKATDCMDRVNAGADFMDIVKAADCMDIDCMNMVKAAKGNGAQCIGQCTNCGDMDPVKGADCMDMVKVAKPGIGECDGTAAIIGYA